MTMAAAAPDRPHLPRRVPIEGYGKGGFRFGDMSHRGSLLCLPDGIWAWPVDGTTALTDEAFASVFDRGHDLDFFIVGTGTLPWIMPDPLRQRFREMHVSADTMTTGAAVRTYNVMLMESRRVGAGLIAID